MKKRSKVLAVLLCAAMAFTAGCSGKAEGGADTETKEETSESDEYLSWIEAAWEQYQGEEMHGYTAEWTNVMEDGSTTQSNISQTVDATNKQAVSRFTYTGQEEDVTYYTEEDGKSYMYNWTYTGDESRQYYKVSLDGQEEAGSYADFANENHPFESTDYRTISNVMVSKEGEEELDGVSVVKLKVEFESQIKAEEPISRESVMADWGWTEDDIALLDGFSDVLDAYVEESNARQERSAKPVANTATVYLTNDEEHKLVRMEESQEYTEEEQQDSVTSPALSDFYDLNGKLDYLKSLISEGVDKDEAMGLVNEAYDGMESEEESPTVSGSGWTNYLTGDACEPVGELPAAAAELTWDQWRNGEY